MADLEIRYQATSDLKPYENNSRTHSKEQIDQIVRSIKEFGFTNPILIDEHNEIIAGHGRLEAAQKIGINLVPTIILEGLNEEHKKAYVIADNRLALNAGWDLDMLSVELKGLDELGFDLDLLGFDQNELEQVMGVSPNFEPASEDEQGKLDELDPKWVD